MEWLDKAIVLQIGKFKENDLWLRILTQKHGIITCFAFGASKSRRRFCGCLDILNQINIKVNQKNNFFILLEASLIAAPDRLRYDSKRLGIAINCVRFLECYGLLPDDSIEVYALFFNLLESLENELNIASNLAILFRYKLAVINGYGLTLNNCQICGNSEHIFYAVNEGYVVCKNCIPHNAWIIKMDNEAQEILFAVENNKIENWFLPEISTNGIKQSSQVIDALIAYHLGIEWHNTYFRRI